MATKAKARRRRLSHEQRRELILAAAMQVFAERGYEAASMGEIAGEAGITPAVIYDHFPSKAKLQIELLEGQTTELLSHVGTALQAAPDDPTERMRAGVDAFFGFVEEHRFTWRILFRDPPSDPEVAAAYLRLERRATAGIATFIETGAGDALAGYADPGQAAEIFAEGLKAAQNGLAAWWYEHPEVPREEIVDRLLELCWDGLGRVAKSSSKGTS
jgi:AcrR family transcriptional regulator